MRVVLGILSLLLCVTTSFAQNNQPRRQPKPAGEEEDVLRYALLIGVNEYDENEQLPSLNYCENDVKALGESLKKIGYDVTILSDSQKRNRKPTKKNILDALSTVTNDKLGEKDSVIIAFSGHGVTYGKEHFFCPSDAKLGQEKSESLVNLTKLFEELSECRAGAKMLFVDACRNTPNKSATNRNKDEQFLIPEKMPTGVGALFSCDRGQKSYENDKYEHSYLYFHLIQEIEDISSKKKNVKFNTLADIVAEKVQEDTAKNKNMKQIPQARISFSGVSPQLVYFKKDGPPKPDDEIPPPSKTSSLIVYLDKDKQIPFELIKIEPKKDEEGGEFLLMGPKNLQSKDGFENTDTQYEFPSLIRLSKPYWIAKYPVTVKQFRAYLEATNKDGAELRGEHVKGWSDEGLAQKNYGWDKIGFKQEENHPVVGITRENARDFLKWVQKRYERQYDNSDDKRVFRLPTEAEWEYACRAGKKTAYFFGNDINELAKHGNFLDPGSRKNDGFPTDKPYLGKPDGYAHTSPVGKFLPNGLGLFDMHGNVWQMCEDGFINQPFEDGETDPVRLGEYSKFVAKGGSWLTRADDCRSSSREEYDPNEGYAHIGFRPCFGVKLDDSDGGGTQQNGFIWKQLYWPVENGGDGQLYWWKCNKITGVDFDGPFVDQNGNRPNAPQPSVGGGVAPAKQKRAWVKDGNGQWWIVDPDTKKKLEGPFNQGPAGSGQPTQPPRNPNQGGRPGGNGRNDINDGLQTLNNGIQLYNTLNNLNKNNGNNNNSRPTTNNQGKKKP